MNVSRATPKTDHQFRSHDLSKAIYEVVTVHRSWCHCRSEPAGFAAPARRQQRLRRQLVPVGLSKHRAGGASGEARPNGGGATAQRRGLALQPLADRDFSGANPFLSRRERNNRGRKQKKRRTFNISNSKGNNRVEKTRGSLSQLPPLSLSLVVFRRESALRDVRVCRGPLPSC